MEGKRVKITLNVPAALCGLFVILGIVIIGYACAVDRQGLAWIGFISIHAGSFALIVCQVERLGERLTMRELDAFERGRQFAQRDLHSI